MTRSQRRRGRLGGEGLGKDQTRMTQYLENKKDVS